MFAGALRRLDDAWQELAGRVTGSRLPPRLLGRMGERRAAWFYRVRGYRISARNLRFADGEIDLVARRGRTMVIAEVKARQTLSAGHGYDSVDARKREQLVRLADRHVAIAGQRVELRYDVLSLYWTGRRFIVTCFRDAFRPVSDRRRPWRWRA